MDTRSTVRYPIDLAARLRVGETELSCRIANLSLGGVYIIGPSLPIGTRCRLRFKGPQREPFDSWCIARWTTPDGCGLQFDSLHAMGTYQLARLIRQASRVTLRMPALERLRPPAR